MIRARRACAILRNLGEVARTYLCLDRERRVREGTCPAKGTGFSNLHSVGRIRMRPVTNRGLRRRRPPRTRATVTRIVSSPLPSLSTDTGGRYMSLSTRPARCSLHGTDTSSTVLVPPRTGHATDELVVDGCQGNHGDGPGRRSVDARGSDVGYAVHRTRRLPEDHGIILGTVTYAVDGVESVHAEGRRTRDVVAAWRRILNHLPARVAAQVRAAVSSPLS